MNYSGNVITKNPVQPSLTSAPGVWSLQEAQNAVANGTWPIPGVINPISKSLRFNSADSTNLDRTFASAGNQKTWTWSGWVKLGAISGSRQLFSGGSSVSDQIFIGDTTPYLYVYLDGAYRFISAAFYRDPSAWYHFVIQVDTTQATASNRTRVYVNGIQSTDSGGSAITQNNNTKINGATTHYIGRYAASASEYFSGYMTEINFVDGQALTPSAFGLTDPNTGVWVPKKYTGTYGINGFYLNFSDSNSTTLLGYDYSGNGNNWTPNNFSVTAGAGNDSLTDVPTLWTPYTVTSDTGGVVRGNYATLNPLSNLSSLTLANGNLDGSRASASWASARATFGMSSGKWYWEITPITGISPGSTTNQIMIGISLATASSAAFYDSAGGWGYYFNDGNKWNNSSGAAYGSSYTNNDVIGVAFDADAGTLTFYKNGVSQGTAYTGLTSGPYFPTHGHYGTSSSVANFGQRPFAYTPPSGYKSLCTTNLPTPTIGAASTTLAGNYFNAVTYTGTGSALGVTGVGFQPDFVWIKSRSAATDHALYDAVRGVQKQVESNTTTAETTETQGLTAFDTNGFNLGTLAQVNTVNATYVGWNWKAGGTGVTNTTGSITSTVSANTTAGFSVVTYTGTGANATVGHGLGVAPSMIIVKQRDATTDWYVYHSALAATDFIRLNLTNAKGTNTGVWNSTAPTSTVFSLGGYTEVDANTKTYVAYCFAAVAGYSAFGSYTGNGSSDGVFVYLGFRARYLMLKSSSGTGGWVLLDTARDPYNDVDNYLYADSSAANAGSSNVLDINSNGFKIRNSWTDINGNGSTYIYAAFAESPFKFANAR